MPKVARAPWWAWTWPALAFAVMIATMIFGTAGAMAALAGAILIAAVFAAVYHAEVVAHRVGEPFGTLVLALAVTIIEVALIWPRISSLTKPQSLSRRPDGVMPAVVGVPPACGIFPSASVNADSS